MTTALQLLDEIAEKVESSREVLKEASLEDLPARVKGIQLEMVERFALPGAQVRLLDLETLERIISSVESEKGGQLFFRHGEQDPGPEVLALPEASKKIAMMQLPHNRDDPITLNSALEWVGTMMALIYIQAKTGYTISVEASSNQRALQPAEALGKTLEVPCEAPADSIWNCIDYSKEVKADCPHMDSKGNVAWEKSKIDGVVGEGTFDKITADMQAVVAEEMKPETIHVIITHTQQIEGLYAAAAPHAPALGRLSNYGFIFRSPEGLVTQCKNGFYQSETLVLESKKEATLGF